MHYLTHAQIVLRINCLSTEFSSQKGVKGIPLHFVTDTYEDIDTDSAEPVHRAYCKVKIFRDKVIIIMLHMHIYTYTSVMQGLFGVSLSESVCRTRVAATRKLSLKP